MAKWKKLSQTIYQCKYHIVWCPKYRYRILKGALSKSVEQTLEMNVREDHIHMILNIPPRLSIPEVVGMLKGKIAIKLFKSYPGLKRKPYWGNHFWSREYCVSTIGLGENKIRKYVKYQEEKEKSKEDEQQEFGLF
jgi:putative transposase